MNLLQRGRSAEAEAQFEKLLGGSHVKSAMVEMSKSDRGDEVVDKVKLSELLYGRHFKGTYFFSYLLHLGINFLPDNYFDFSICSGFHWVFSFCLATAIWHKCCILFLINCL